VTSEETYDWCGHPEPDLPVILKGKVFRQEETGRGQPAMHNGRKEEFKALPAALVTASYITQEFIVERLFEMPFLRLTWFQRIVKKDYLLIGTYSSVEDRLHVPTHH